MKKRSSSYWSLKEILEWQEPKRRRTLWTEGLSISARPREVNGRPQRSGVPQSVRLPWGKKEQSCQPQQKPSFQQWKTPMWPQGVAAAVAAQAAGQISLLLGLNALPGQCTGSGEPKRAILAFLPLWHLHVPSSFDLTCCDRRDETISQMCYGKASHS